MLKYLIILLFGIGCWGQTPILPLFTDLDNENIPGAYFKDTYNDFDSFTGTWVYSNGSTQLKITLQKKIQSQDFAKGIGFLLYFKNKAL